MLILLYGVPLKMSICGICERFTILRFGICKGCFGKGIKSTYIGIQECIECHKIKTVHAKERCRTCYNRLQSRLYSEKVKAKKKRLYYKHHEKQKFRSWEYQQTEKTRIKQRNDWLRRKALYIEFISKFKIKCMRCDYNRCQRALEFHHKNPNNKAFGLSMNTWQRLPREQAIKLFKKEMKKCVLLCANCHRELDEGIWNLNELQTKLV